MTAEQIKQLDAIKEGTLVSLSYTQRPNLSVCRLNGRIVPRLEGRNGYIIIGANGNGGNLLLSDNVIIMKTGRKLHIRVDLAGQRIVKSQITLDVRNAITQES
jgi:hypothetical protein